MLEITDLHVSIGDREVLHDINLTIPDGETHVMMGPNGSGKTTLLRTIMGFAGNEVTAGSIVFNGEDVTRHAAARAGRTRAWGCSTSARRRSPGSSSASSWT